MIFRQLYDHESSTYTYLLGDPASRQAIVIDPVYEQHARDAALVRELELRLALVLDTHVHADHVTGAWLLEERLGARIVLSRRAGAEGVDVPVDDGDVLEAGALRLEVRATPGHTSGCVTYVTADQTMAFTGDALLIRGAGRTDFQSGSARTLFRSVRERIFTLPDDTLLYPAHDYAGRTVTSVGEEKRWNPRLGGDASEEDFVGYMENLGLPHPKQIDVAVPANLRSGRPTDARPAPELPRWAPVVRTYAGVPEVAPSWVAEHRGEVLLIDVREPAELDGELGRLGDALPVPLGELRARLGALPRDRPIVTVCRSGRRSAQACAILEKAGFGEVANVAGGMLRWRALRLP